MSKPMRDVRPNGTPTPPPSEETQAREVLNALPRREELRRQISEATRRHLDGLDTTVMVGIGLLGALPTYIPAALHPTLQRALGMVVQGRAQLVEQLRDGKPLPVTPVLEVLGQHSDNAIWLASLFGHAQEAGLLPDWEDGFESAGTALLTDRWCSRKGWTEGTQIYHEAKALAFAVNAVFGAYFNPDPIAFGLATWHGWRVLRASKDLTRWIIELNDRAIKDGQEAIRASDSEICATDGSRLRGPASLPWGAADNIDVLLPPQNPRRRS